MSSEPQNRYHRYKAKIYEILGGVCVRCGFSDARALQLDHIHGGGWRGTKVSSNGVVVNKGYSHTYLKAILDDPEIKQKYQILCANCNWIKRCENKEVALRRRA